MRLFEGGSSDHAPLLERLRGNDDRRHPTDISLMKSSCRRLSRINGRQLQTECIYDVVANGFELELDNCDTSVVGPQNDFAEVYHFL